MMAKKSGATAATSLLPSDRDLHQEPLISMSGLLKLLSGANAMSLKRWRDSRDMPAPVAHGKYSLTATLKWVWDWRCEIEEEADSLRSSGKSSPVSDQMEALKLRRLQREEDAADRIVVNRVEYEDAEAARISMAVAILETIPDRLISEGVLKESARERARDLVAEAVTAVSKRIEQQEDNRDDAE